MEILDKKSVMKIISRNIPMEMVEVENIIDSLYEAIDCLSKRNEELSKEIGPVMGPTYRFQNRKLAEKVDMLSKSNQKFLERDCRTCSYYFNERCNKYSEIDLAEFINLTGCGLFIEPGILK